MNMRSVKSQVTFCAAMALTCAGLLAGPIYAEVIEVPVGQQGQARQGVKRPQTGMKQSEVEAQYGLPQSWTPAVGNPPISSWVYEDFVVYFEYDRVLHSVLRPTPEAAQATVVE
ncbi:hypothetical protein [Aurantivibrio plasticivorans]